MSAYAVLPIATRCAIASNHCTGSSARARFWPAPAACSAPLCTADSTSPQKRSIDASDWRASSLGLIVSGAGGIAPESSSCRCSAAGADAASGSQWSKSACGRPSPPVRA